MVTSNSSRTSRRVNEGQEILGNNIRFDIHAADIMEFKERLEYDNVLNVLVDCMRFGVAIGYRIGKKQFQGH